MNADQLKGKWHQWKGDAKVTWSKLTDDELTKVNGEAEKLLGALQQRYGYARDRAEKEVDRFIQSHEATPKREDRTH